jgi:hypothetical protein
VLHNPLLAKIVGTEQAVAAGHSLSNLNTFLKKYTGAIGIKPGYTDNAGLCLVAAAVHNGHTVITVLLNSSDINGESATLLNYAFGILDSNTTLTQGGPGQNTLSKGDPSQYIGYPNADKLLSPDQVNDPYSFGQVINAQVDETPNPSNITPNPVNGDTNTSNSANTSGGSGNDPNKNKGGINFFVVLLILIIIGGGLYMAARLGYLGGDSGRAIAFRVEDGIIVMGRSLQRLLHQLRPANNDADEAKTYRSQLPAPKSNPNSTTYTRSDNNDLNYRERVQGNNRPATPNSYSTSGRLAPTTPPTPRPTPAQPKPPTPAVSTRQQSSEIAKNPNNLNSELSQPAKPRNSSSNPLEGFFDDVNPFEFEAQAIQPPQPLRTPFNNTPPQPKLNQTTNPQPAKSTPTSAGLNTPNTPIPPTPTRNRGTEIRAESVPNQESLNKRAQQAIDYAFAGRMQASTDEFRRVVEQNPLFDFGSIDDFEQMPVLGYKALANAYSAANKGRFAIMLLEMAIEKFPNDLELRNMSRTFRREMGQ